jgi:hypothetical protein
MSDTIQSAEECWSCINRSEHSCSEPCASCLAEPSDKLPNYSIDPLINADRAAHIALGREMERTARAEGADTIQSAATNNIGGFLDSLVDLISEDAGQEEWIKAGELLEARDAAIRADEARKQEERYAACVEAAREYQKDHCKYCSDIPRCEECSINKIRKALADLEAPK